MLLAALAVEFDWGAIFKTATGISTIIGLVGFFSVVALTAYAIKIRADTQRLKDLPEGDRAGSLDSFATRHRINLDGISPAKQYDLVLREMNLRWRKQILEMSLLVVVVLFCFTMAWLSRPPPPTPPGPDGVDPDQFVIECMYKILILRGEFEARPPGWSGHVRDQGLMLATLIGNVEPDRLRPARKIVQHEYKGWALLMVARTFGAEIEETDAAHRRLIYAKQAVDELDTGLRMMSDIEARFTRGEGGKETQDLYRWLKEESFDVERSKYLKAVAFAVIARAGGQHTRADVVTELEGISPSYLRAYPPDDNPDLRWARHPEAP